MHKTAADDVVAVSALRTPIGKFGGALRETPVYELGAAVIKATLQRTGIAADALDEVLLGCCREAGNGPNPARTAARLGGVPLHVPACTVNMACAAGMRAVIMAGQLLQLGPARFVLAGGMESMSTVPYLLKGARWEHFRSGDRTLMDGLDDCKDPLLEDPDAIMENLVKKHGLTRREQDQYALESHQKAARASDSGLFDTEIVPVSVDVDSAPVTVTHDEAIRRDTTIRKLARLPAFHRGGSMTAGNASSLADGASALLLTTREVARAHGLKPLFSLMSSAVAAVDPQCLYEGPSVALPLALQQARLSLGDLDFIEINESFAAMALANERLLKWDPERVNRHGGTIALGHPSGCTGSRLMVTLYHILKANDGELGGTAISGAGGVTAAVLMRREQ